MENTAMETTVETNETTPVAPDNAEAEIVDAGEPSQADAELTQLKKQLETERLAKKKAEEALTLEKRAHTALKRTQMTEAEQAAETRKELEAQAQQYKIMMSKASAIQTLNGAGLKDDDYSDWIDMLVSDDADRTATLAQSVVDLLARKTAAAAKAEREKVLKETPVPQTGNPDPIDPFIEAFKKG